MKLLPNNAKTKLPATALSTLVYLLSYMPSERHTLRQQHNKLQSSMNPDNTALFIRMSWLALTHIGVI